MEETLLQGSFQMLPSCRELYDVSLTRKNVMFKAKSGKTKVEKLTSVLIQNLIGCRMFESKIASDACCFIQLAAMTKNKKGVRQRQDYTFRINESQEKQENMVIGDIWALTIFWLLYDPDIGVDELQEKNVFPPEKKFFVMINPKSGSGKSSQLFKSSVEPFYKAARIKYTIFITESAGHCKEISQTLDFKDYDAIIICSGDGLVFELINGIMCRKDWQECLKIPIAILPTGSGNALFASIAHAASEVKSLTNAVYITLKGASHPMDLFRVENSKRKYYAFLSATWGIMSDVDIESEKYRSLGALRFTIGGLTRIFKLRHYRGKFSYLLGERKKTSEEVEIATVKISQKLEQTEEKAETYAGEKVIEAPPPPATSIAINSDDTQLCGHKSSLPDIGADLPDTWKTTEGEFVTIGVTSLTHLGIEMYSSPRSDFNDGLLNTQLIRKGITKKRMLDVFLAFETGKHLDFPEVEELDIVAFRLEPDMSSNLGNIAVDGELIEYDRIQGEILPSLANIITM